MYQIFAYFHAASSFLRDEPGLSYQFMVTINVEATVAAVAICSMLEEPTETFLRFLTRPQV